jgi:hypothetical protein
LLSAQVPNDIWMHFDKQSLTSFSVSIVILR